MFEFDFEVQGDEIEFNFVFLSEEYNEFVGTGFNDVFAFYISGPGITGQENLAVVPSTTTPVTINTINNGSFWQYYNDNTAGGVNIEYDGFTTLMKAQKSGLIPCGIYTLSLRIAVASRRRIDASAGSTGAGRSAATRDRGLRLDRDLAKKLARPRRRSGTASRSTSLRATRY